MKNLFFALVFILIGTYAFANNAKEIELSNNKKEKTITKTVKSIKSGYEVIVKRIITDSGCTELHVVCHNGRQVCSYD